MENRYAWTVPLRERHPVIQWALGRGVMLKDVCADLGVSRPTLHYWDKGRCVPSPLLQQKIREYTNNAVTPTNLLDHYLSKTGKQAA